MDDQEKPTESEKDIDLCAETIASALKLYGCEMVWQEMRENGKTVGGGIAIRKKKSSIAIAPPNGRLRVVK